jgi:type II secretory pathway pseudopilin PulG
MPLEANINKHCPAGTKHAFSLLELIILITMVLVLVALLLPGVVQRTQGPSKRSMCMQNLKNIGFALRIWAVDSSCFPMALPTNAHSGGTAEFLSIPASTFRHFQIISNELSKVEMLTCPADLRKPGQSFGKLTETNISYFVGVDAEQTKGSLWLAGDRNLITNGFPFTNGLMILQTNSVTGWDNRMHKGCGNVGLADGSVQWFDGPHLQKSMLDGFKAYPEVQRLSVP